MSLLNCTDAPVPRWRIVHDLLALSADDPRSVTARAQLSGSRWVTELAGSREEDGSWGRFHSRDSCLRKRFPTTELAIQRALSLGLEKDSGILSQTMQYLHDILDGKTAWIDPPEVHEGWRINIHSITAATLALLDPLDPALAETARNWTAIVASIFTSGSYSAKDERQAHLRIHGIHTSWKYLKLASLYSLLLLSCPASGLDPALEKKLLAWVVGETGWHLLRLWWPHCRPTRDLLRPFHRLVARPRSPLTFPDVKKSMRGSDRLAMAAARERSTGYGGSARAIDWLWRQRESSALWDFGPQARNNSFVLPLSESWQNIEDRRVDCSILALEVIRRYLPQ